MIIYGYNSSNIGNTKPPSLKCPSCENTGTTSLHSFGKYATLFWIPMFPMGKKIVSECSHCQAAFEKKQMPDDFNLAIQNLKDQSKTPLWNWAGLAIVACLFIWGGIQSRQHDSDILVHLENPAANDTYNVKQDNGNYTSFKVSRVANDSIYFRMNNYEIETSNGLSELDEDENYGDDIYSMHKSRLKELFNNNDITDISRN